ncbi:FAD/NAD(P)-binding domain-containing protein [Setomelanomma holmii]|uniref:FAD/NAD(P)-binding domain-containing protein n=1 Tax=Setomelanomma holmii TaxID=210430 RepID=A0A9P4LJX7_9PLEO|nr:FAD/NAD(P)-binding domain-containing protein [Setomelanomma holmii]
MVDQTPQLKVLIVGSGIAGPCFAFWLNKVLPSSDITILERAPEPRLGGQAVDIRSAAVPIVERMGLLQAVKDKTTTEVGIDFVYADGKTKATFPASGDAEQQSMTSEFEILRGDMAKILYESTKDTDRIKYIFGETISKVEQKAAGKVDVIFEKHLQPTTYDLVVGADGMRSRTRRLVFGHGPKNDDYLYRLGQYTAYFTIPRADEDTQFAQWYNATRGRLILKRPDQYGTTRVYIAVTDSDMTRFDEIDEALREKGQREQQAWIERVFEGAGWLTERVIKGMKEADDFYMQEIAQVKMPKWSKGHVALVGDAAYCPSPISGVGTGSAIVGTYVLAGEISKSPHDIPAALERYEATLRPFIEKVQKLIPGAPQIANPQTEWGIALFNHTMGIISHPFMRRFGGLVGKIAPAFGKNEWNLPDYNTEEKS